MTFIVTPVGSNGQCCDCASVIDACSSCTCPSEIGEATYVENHGYDECPEIGPPCYIDSPSCANLTIGPIPLYSQIFSTSCLEDLEPRAFASFYADNYGSMYGETSINFDDGPCAVGTTSGTIIPFIETINPTQSRAYVFAFAQNSVAGGPYGIEAFAQFYLQ